MATIENGTGPTELAAELRKMPDEGLIAQSFVQQGAVHAVSWLLANGCNEERAAEMLDTEEDPARLWAEIHLLRAAVQGPDGYATWKDAAVAERVRRVHAEQALKDSRHAPTPGRGPRTLWQWLQAWRERTGFLMDGRDGGM